MKNIWIFILILFLVTPVAYANELHRVPIKASNDTVILKKRVEIQPKRADDDMGLIINDISEVKQSESGHKTISIEPKYKEYKKYKSKRRKIDINKLQPQNPEEIYSCEDNDDYMFYDDEVCARQIIFVQCIRAPCPTEEHWSTYPSVVS